MGTMRLIGATTVGMAMSERCGVGRRSHTVLAERVIRSASEVGVKQQPCKLRPHTVVNCTRTCADLSRLHLAATRLPLPQAYTGPIHMSMAGVLVHLNILGHGRNTCHCWHQYATAVVNSGCHQIAQEHWGADQWTKPVWSVPFESVKYHHFVSQNIKVCQFRNTNDGTIDSAATPFLAPKSPQVATPRNGSEDPTDPNPARPAPMLATSPHVCDSTRPLKSRKSSWSGEEPWCVPRKSWDDAVRSCLRRDDAGAAHPRWARQG